MYVALGILGGLMLFVGGYALLTYRRKHLGIWLWAYYGAEQRRRRRLRPAPETRTHLLFCFVDHFEPLSGPTQEAELDRLRAWCDHYPKIAAGHRDSDGRPPQHTWFYPGENYDAACLDTLARLAGAGYGEIELHYHHGYDTPERLTAKFQAAIEAFARHGALITAETPPRVAYGFIHGNLALNNSRGIGHCGVNEELPILKQTGCYADFSMPTAPCESQTRKINAIYYAANRPGRPKSHDDGVDVAVGGQPSGDLMLITGPLALNWQHRKFGLLPRVENGEIQDGFPPTRDRIRLWAAQNIHVAGRPEWVVVKVACHGAEDRNREVLLGAAADQMYADLEAEYRDRPGYALHYVTARELFNIIKAAEAGATGDPGRYRDFLIPPYRTHAGRTAARRAMAG